MISPSALDGTSRPFESIRRSLIPVAGWLGVPCGSIGAGVARMKGLALSSNYKNINLPGRVRAYAYDIRLLLRRRGRAHLMLSK
jgi:hypothetical protein